MTEEKTDLGLPFSFSLQDHGLLVNHWMLQDLEVAKAISETPEFKGRGSKTLTARVTVNGVELSFASLEKMLVEMYERMEKRSAEKYSDVEAEVQRRLEERLITDAKPIVNKLWELQQVLEDPSQVLVPHWDRHKTVHTKRQVLYDAADSARNTALQEDVNDQIGALNAAVNAVVDIIEKETN